MTAGLFAISGVTENEVGDRLDALQSTVTWRGSVRDTVVHDGWTVRTTGKARMAHDGAVLVALHGSNSCQEPGELATEVGALGVGALVALRSDHAAFVLDGRTQRAHLSRDFMGTRPLYWARSGSATVISSEPLAVQILLGLEYREDQEIVDAYLARQKPGIRRSFYAGVQQLAPDTVVTLGSPLIERIRPFEPAAPVSDSQAVERVRSTLRSAVRTRARSSDTVACNASGGLDSGVVAAATAADGLATMFLTHRVDGLADDETSRASELAQRHAVRHEIVDIAPSDVVTRLLPTMIAHGPLHPTAWLSGATVEHAAKAGANVLLAGHLGDHWVTMAGGSLVQAARDRDLKNVVRFAPEFRQDSSASLVRTLGMCMKNVARGIAFGGYAAACRETFRTDPWVQLTVASMERFGALHGVQVELPFADRDLVETLLGCTASQRNAPGTPKQIYRDAFADILPDSYVNDPIKANFFSVPAMALEGEAEGYEAYRRIRELQVDAWCAALQGVQTR